VRHERHSKRATAQAMVDVMAAFGHDRFALAGHDRGARVAHRLCLDHPAAVARVAMLDVAPTRTVFARIDRALATDYYHWFWFIQPYDLPERLIGADPSWYLRRHMQAWAGRLDYFHPLALAEYERCFALPGTVHATCEDYRAAASIDLAHDDDDAKAGRRIECPLLALWGERGLVPRHFDVPAVWRDCARDVRGQGIAAGHALVEEAPAATLRALRAFFAV
jgi:haloacetate dehalogenase